LESNAEESKKVGTTMSYMPTE